MNKGLNHVPTHFKQIMLMQLVLPFLANIYQAFQMLQKSINYVHKDVPTAALCKKIAATCLQAK